MKPMMIYGSLDGATPMWFLVRKKLQKPVPGNVIHVKAFAIWMTPRQWTKVRVESVTTDGSFSIYVMTVL